ncbi:GAP family protein [Paenarthrobacter sp. NPDC056912]|uniref:GAP family protein n=1 Tax=Paenarthrobacter sp. NPDC056912 TaxID=3345965 RepID=UPI003672A923
MLSLVVGLLPLALAGAMSTVPVSITIMILLSPNAHRGALPFLIGTLSGAAVVVGLAAIGLQSLPVRNDKPQNVELAAAGFVIAAVLVGYSVHLFRRQNTTDNLMLGRIKAQLDSARPWKFLALGLVLNLRPKALLLSITAGALIGLQGLQLLAGSLFVLGYALALQTAVLVPIVLWLRRPERADVMLTAVDGWMQRNSKAIAASTVLAIGLVIAGFSFSRL